MNKFQFDLDDLDLTWTEGSTWEWLIFAHSPFFHDLNQVWVTRFTASTILFGWLYVREVKSKVLTQSAIITESMVNLQPNWIDVWSKFGICRPKKTKKLLNLFIYSIVDVNVISRFQWNCRSKVFQRDVAMNINRQTHNNNSSHRTVKTKCKINDAIKINCSKLITQMISSLIWTDHHQLFAMIDIKNEIICLQLDWLVATGYGWYIECSLVHVTANRTTKATQTQAIQIKCHGNRFTSIPYDHDPYVDGDDLPMINFNRIHTDDNTFHLFSLFFAFVTLSLALCRDQFKPTSSTIFNIFYLIANCCNSRFNYCPEHDFVWKFQSNSIDKMYYPTEICKMSLVQRIEPVFAFRCAFTAVSVPGVPESWYLNDVSKMNAGWTLRLFSFYIGSWVWVRGQKKY